MSLRAIVTSLVLGCGALVLAGATLLVATTSYLHSAAARMGTALDSVRLVQQLQVESVASRPAQRPKRFNA